MMTADQGLEEAREAFAHRDWVTAREMFLAARELSTDDVADLASACWWLGLADENVSANEEVHRRSLHDGAPARAALAAVEIGFCEMLRGHEDIGAGWFARARRLLDDAPEAPERGFLLVIDAYVAVDSGDLASAEDLATRVLELGDRHENTTLQALGLFLCGSLAIRRGDHAVGLRLLDEAMLPVRAGDVQPEWAGNLYCSMMQLCYEFGDLPRAQWWTTVTEQWCHGYAPAVIFSGICRVHRVQLFQVQGEWDRAEEEARRAAADLRDLDIVVAAEAHYRLGEVCRLRGDLAAAESAYRSAHALGRDPAPGLALLHLRRGHVRVAASALDAALAAAGTPPGRAPLLAARTEVALADKEPRVAARCTDELGRLAEEHASPGWRAEARRWQGAVLLARGKPADAVPALREACGLWQRIGAPYEVARIRLDLAEALDALGDLDTADWERDGAAVLLERLGARRDLDRLHAHSRGRRAAGELSVRELEVVAAIADGISNREAAGRLQISERTVARHLANVYAKTGVSSRTAAVAWARERGLL